MNDAKKPHGRETPHKEDVSINEADGRSAEAAQSAWAENAAEQDNAGQAAEPDPFKVLEALNAENANLKDQVLRTLADMENLRRRTQRDVADTKIYATTNFARDMLTVADNLRRALENFPHDQIGEGPLKSFVDGVELTERDLLKTLERHGVKQITPQGEKFDPNLHQAMFEVPNAELPNGTVVQVMQSGFVIGDRVLRPALVGVSKGGPKANDVKNGESSSAANGGAV